MKPQTQFDFALPTHSDALVDARILRHLEVGIKFGTARAIGVSQNGLSSINDRRTAENFNLWAKRSSLNRPAGRSFMRSLLHGIILIELNSKMLVRLIRTKPSVIVCNDWYVLPSSVAARVILGSTLIYDAHELESQTTGLSSLQSKIIRNLERWSWRWIDSFVTVSNSILRWYTSEYGEKGGTVILNSPVLSEGTREQEETTDLRTKFQIPHDHQIYVYVGIMGEGRGIDPMLEAFGQTRAKASLVFLGWGSDFWESKIRSAAKNCGNIHIHPPVPHTEVVSVVSGADVGICLIEDVSLSDRFCIPNKLLEYAFSGLPVIASSLPEIKTIVEDYGLGICIANNADELLHVLEQEQSEWYSESARGNISELGWEAQIQKLSQLFSNSLKHTRKR